MCVYIYIYIGKHLSPTTGTDVFFFFFFLLKGTGVDFDKICVLCGKCCVYVDKYVFIVIKIKCVNSSRISDICDKINFIIKLHTFYNT
jgi:hypothetical protein